MQKDLVIERFLDNLWAERGLSDNSLESYRHDLLHLKECLSVGGKTLTAAGREDLLDVLAGEVQQGKSPRSISRYLSAYRQFYRWLVREGTIQLLPNRIFAARQAVHHAGCFVPQGVYKGPHDLSRVPSGEMVLLLRAKIRDARRLGRIPSLAVVDAPGMHHDDGGLGRL